MLTPNNGYGFENELLSTYEEKMYNILAKRIKLLLDTGLLSVFQHNTDNNHIIL